MTNLHAQDDAIYARNQIFSALEAERYNAAQSGRPVVDEAEQLELAIISAVESAQMYRQMGREDEAANYMAKAQHLAADYRAIVRG